MPSRSVRRKQHKRLARFETVSGDAERLRRAAQLLQAWRVEARQRAEYLGAPAVWALAANPAVQARAQRADPGGELLSELRRVCAEAVAETAGRHLVRGSRPVADRRRRIKADRPGGGEMR
jgi:hypothetical protein